MVPVASHETPEDRWSDGDLDQVAARSVRSLPELVEDRGGITGIAGLELPGGAWGDVHDGSSGAGRP